MILRLLTLSGIVPAVAAVLGRALSPLGVDAEWVKRLLTGLVEVSSGVSGLGGGGPLAPRVSMAAFILGWAGLSVHCQVLSFLGDSGLSPGTYFAGKALHGVISAALVWGSTRLFPLGESVSAILIQQVDAIAALDFSTALGASVTAAWGLLLAFFLFAIFCGKRKKHVV